MTLIDRGSLWELFVDGLPDFAMVLLDVDGKILGWNAGAANMLGYPAAEVVGRNFSCLFTADDIAEDKPAMALKRAVERGRVGESGRRVRQNGTDLDANSLLIPLYDAQKELVGFGSLMREATGALRAMVPVLGPTQAPGSTQAPGPTQAPDLTQGNVVALRPSAKILVVDDNAQILDTLEVQLTSLGYAVLRASNGAEALDILVRVADIDLLLTDVIMPGGMNGSQLARDAQIIRPRLKVLFTSGYFDVALLRDRAIDPGVRVLAKPYRKQELARRVSEALSA